LTVIHKWILGFQVKVNVLTCDYIDFHCHIWPFWKGYLLSFVVSICLFVFFNNANTVSAEMWIWSFGNHAWYKSLVKSLIFDSWLETFVDFQNPIFTFPTHSIFTLHIWPNFGFEICLWNTKQLITLELTGIAWWNFLWLITMIMVWNDDEMVGVAASLSQPRSPNQG
jgi:hypothetical protein